MPEHAAQPDPPRQAVNPGRIVPQPATGADREPPLVTIARQRQETLAGLLGRVGSDDAKAKNEGSPDVELVHDLRVASRRLGEAARLLAALMDKPVAKAVETGLRQLRRSAGDLRDLDVLREHLEKWRIPAKLRPLRREILAAMPPQRATLAGALRKQVVSPGFTACLVLLSRELEEQTGQPGTETRLERELATLIRKRRRKVSRAFGKAARKQTPAALHAARIAVKKLRYGLELQEEAELNNVKNVKTELKFLKKLQQLLGDMHDTDVVLALLHDHLDQQHPPPPGLRAAWRHWRRAMDHRQAQRAAEFFAASYLWMNGKV